MSSILPRYDRFGNLVPLVNKELKDLCCDRKHVFIDLPVFPVNLFKGDGIHLRPYGYKYLSNSFSHMPGSYKNIWAAHDDSLPTQ